MVCWEFVRILLADICLIPLDRASGAGNVGGRSGVVRWSSVSLCG